MDTEVKVAVSFLEGPFWELYPSELVLFWEPWVRLILNFETGKLISGTLFLPYQCIQCDTNVFSVIRCLPCLLILDEILVSKVIHV